MNYDLIIFDADGTLRRCTVPGQPCPNQPGEWELIPGVVERLRQVDWTHTQFAIASNQAGVGLGYMAEETAWQMLLDLQCALRKQVAIPTGQLRMCPHRPDAGCTCRKPAPGMLLDILAACDVSPERTLYVGDMESDRQAAKNAGVLFCPADEFFHILSA